VLCGSFISLVAVGFCSASSGEAVPAAKGGMKPASELICPQEKARIFPEILQRVQKEPGEPVSILVQLSRQRAHLMVGGRVAVDFPISSGRRNGWTPKGDFLILEKDPDHHSNLYGDFVTPGGAVIRSGVSSKLDAAPGGSRFRGAPMKYFLRLTPEGVGMHAGILPGYPASHGCIRLPRDIAELIYNTVAVKTPVSVTE